MLGRKTCSGTLKVLKRLQKQYPNDIMPLFSWHEWSKERQK